LRSIPCQNKPEGVVARAKAEVFCIPTVYFRFIILFYLTLWSKSIWCNEMKANVDRVGASEVLRTVPPDQSFLFFEDIGKYTGRLATSLDDFCEIIKTIDIKSLTFHFRRGDYERWIRESLHDVQLAGRLKRINKSNSGEELRNKILQAVGKRLDELHEMLR